MKEQKSYRGIWISVLAILAIGALFILFFSSCKVLKSIKDTTKDSTSVNKTSEGSVRSDSSGTKSDKTNTKEIHLSSLSTYCTTESLAKTS